MEEAAAIRGVYGQFATSSYRRIVMGWETVVMEVDGRYMFKFPKYSGGWRRIRGEIELLRWLAPRIGAQVPKYEFIWQGSNTLPRRFAGYGRIQGTPCTNYNYRSKWGETLGKDLGLFLTDLHSMRIPSRFRLKMKNFEPKEWAEFQRNRYYRRTRRYVFPLLDPSTIWRAKAFWKEFLDHLAIVEYKPKFIHSDITAGNMIVDPVSGRLAGVIDWADAKYGDPADDFVGIFEVNRRLGRIALGHYDGDKRGFQERIDLYLKGIPFQEIADGVQLNVDRFVKLGLGHLRKRLG
jgi:aminoglycoside 2''-phosphotransferase